jgi:hypothetical protein
MPNNFELEPAAAKGSNSIALLVIVAAIFLVVLAGLFMAIGAVIAFFLAAGAKGAPTPSTLLHGIAVVLLILVLIILLILLFCCCKGGAKGIPRDLLRLLPALMSLPDALRATATALRSTGESLALIQTNIEDAGNLLKDTALQTSSFQITVPTFNPEPFGDSGFYYVKDLGTATLDLNILKTALDNVGTELKSDATEIETLRTDLTTAATALDGVATILSV